MKALEIKNLRKVYGGKFEAVKGISFSIEPGDFYALLGPNGAGKSTTIGIIASLVNKTSGQVSVFGYDLDQQQRQVKCQLGLVPQEFNFNVFEKVLNIMIQQAGYYGIPAREARLRAEKYLKQLDLWDKRNEIARNLSGGMKRRLMIARALVHEPRLLILDEPTAGVDIEIRRSMWAFLREINQKGTTIILTTHYLEEVEELCRNVAIINHGEIIIDTSIKELLHKLHKQTFVLDLAQPVDQVPPNNQLIYHLIDPYTLEVELPKNASLNVMFAHLQQFNIQVLSMRGKSSRVESMFLDLIQGGGSL